MTAQGLGGVRSLCEAFQRTAARDPSAVALRTPGGSTEITWREYGHRVRRLAGGLAGLGVGPGDTVALMMTNRPEFNLCDTAALHLGAVPFSVYNTLPTSDIAHLFRNARNRIVICEEQFVATVSAAGGEAIDHVVCVDGRPAGTTTLAELEARGETSDLDFEAAWRRVGPHDLLTIIYTSGTTGPPKGVELTHGNLLAELAATNSVLPLGPGDRNVSYLPSAHIGDRWATHYQSLAYGLQITCLGDATQLAAALCDVRPTVFGAVPRIWEKIKAALEAGFELEGDADRKRALTWALGVGADKLRAEQAAIAAEGPGPDAALVGEHARADELVLSRIRDRLGLGDVRWTMSGAAPTSLDVLGFFGAIGLPICEVWGMSELSAISTINPPGRSKLGTVGPAIPGVELRLDADGELLARGATVMRGYRNDAAKTAETVDEEGWLHTGDIARLDADGYARIIDRKKELIINAAGKNMSPANIEARLKAASRLIGQAVAIGDARPYNVALIVLDPDACQAFAAGRSLADSSPQTLCDHPELQAAVRTAVDEANSGLSRVEQIKAFRVLADEWQPASDELTPTMKLKRRAIAEKYGAEIERLYVPQSSSRS